MLHSVVVHRQIWKHPRIGVNVSIPTTKMHCSTSIQIPSQSCKNSHYDCKTINPKTKISLSIQTCSQLWRNTYPKCETVSLKIEHDAFHYSTVHNYENIYTPGVKMVDPTTKNVASQIRAICSHVKIHTPGVKVSDPSHTIGAPNIIYWCSSYLKY